ncbi:MAB_1171c family putative transporter [Streptomyces hawaiiensis]|uniref:Regulator component n=2 Tax=Streptomyces hawaiiensis TaxID=67305 RepID=A0A6G5RNK6_9ACTN|nr:MAB_1171c family putative transporter [Streptomyces hawaiiensis]QCD59157.1 regulator component [Streptomyces hawaiiensis]
MAGLTGWSSVIAMWTALAWRARSALRLAHQRGLWLAVLAAAIAITLFQPEIIAWSTGATGDAHAITLTRNLVGVLSAGLTLLFLVGPVYERHLQLTLSWGLVIVVAVLLLMDLSEGAYPGPSIPLAGGPASPSTVYWLIVIIAHLVTDCVATIVCWQHVRQTDDHDLVWSLRLFAVGSLLAVAYWATYLVHLYNRVPVALPYVAVAINVHGLFRAASLLVPTATAYTRKASALRTIWILWPLWRDLLKAVPDVALVQPRRTRIQEVLWPSTSLVLQAHRQTIEIYDALLGLRFYVYPGAYDHARQHAQRIGVPADRHKAAALAGAMGQARRAKLAAVPSSKPSQLPYPDSSDLAQLLHIARLWPLMADALPDPSEPVNSPCRP